MKLLILLVALVPLCSEPWGKDADLAGCRKPCTPPKQAGIGVKIAETLIGFHQNHISKTDGPRSHYYPSSSQYTKEAIQKYGFFYGYLLGCDRLMRENEDPWIYPNYQGTYNTLKYDPVK